MDLSAMRDALRAERLRKRWSLDDLAKASGVNRSTIHDIETNRDGKPQIATVAKLVEGMELSLAEFFSLIQDLKSPASPKDNTPPSPHGKPNLEGVSRDSGPLPGGGVPSNQFVNEAIIIGVAEQLATHFDRAIERLIDARLAETQRQARDARAHPPVRGSRRRKTG